MQKRDLQMGEIVQIDPEHDDVFGGAFMVVTEPKSWGAQGYCVPLVAPEEGAPRGFAYYRCAFEHMEPTGGFAVWVDGGLAEKLRSWE